MRPASRVAAASVLALWMVLGAPPLGSGPRPANTATASTSFLVTATIQPVCFLGVGGAIVFPTYTASAVTSFTLVGVLCTVTTAYSIGMNAGLAPGATVTTRQMQNGTSTIGYQVFSDSGFSVNWGNTPGTDTVGGTGTGAEIDYLVYAKIPAGQYVTPGSYSDTILVTLNY